MRISIHALREEGDAYLLVVLALAYHFYPRPPRGGRPYLAAPAAAAIEFLSTPSAGRATAPRAPLNAFKMISIHALREEGDICSLGYDQLAQIFLSTPSARRATAHHNPAGLQRENFYPRPPRGGRLLCLFGLLKLGVISIHALHEEGDLTLTRASCSSLEISIHALREEGDRRAM